MQWSRLVPDNNNTTIKQWTKGLGRKWPGGIVLAAVRTSSGLFGVGRIIPNNTMVDSYYHDMSASR